MTHDEFVDKITNKRWVVGVNDFSVILNECGKKCGRTIYGINYWSLFVLFTAYCIAVAWYDGWGNMVGMILIYWMLRVGRPNINIFDVVWLLVITMAFIGMASLLNWHLSPFLAPLGILPFAFIGSAKFAVLERFTKVLLSDKELYDKMHNEQMVYAVNMG